MEANYKNWFKKTIVTIVTVLLIICVVTIVIDPYFHFHRPITKYRLSEERYINDGIARHFDYNAIITGNSLTQNFSNEQFDKLYNADSVKLPYSGAGYKEIWDSIERSLSYNKNVSIVLVGLDMEDFSREWFWHRYDTEPDYLYDNKICNDVRYILNKEVIYRGSLYNIVRSIGGGSSTSFDEYSSWERETGYKNACESLDRIERMDDSSRRTYSQYDEELLIGNIEKNVLPVVESNPNVTFLLVMPPSSIAKWAEYYNKGEVEWRIEGLKRGLPLLLGRNNVKMYAFDDVYDITENLDLYSDTIHYDASVNEWMLDQISQGTHELTSENYESYLDEILGYYSEYDYTVLNQYIE